MSMKGNLHPFLIVILHQWKLQLHVYECYCVLIKVLQYLFTNTSCWWHRCEVSHPLYSGLHNAWKWRSLITDSDDAWWGQQTGTIVVETESHVGLAWYRVYSFANQWVHTMNYKSYILKKGSRRFQKLQPDHGIGLILQQPSSLLTHPKSSPKPFTDIRSKFTLFMFESSPIRKLKKKDNYRWRHVNGENEITYTCKHTALSGFRIQYLVSSRDSKFICNFSPNGHLDTHQLVISFNESQLLIEVI